MKPKIDDPKSAERRGGYASAFFVSETEPDCHNGYRVLLFKLDFFRKLLLKPETEPGNYQAESQDVCYN